MPKEYEYRFNSYNKKEIITKLKELGAKYFGTFKFRVIVFSDHTNSEKYIRVRDEGHRVTMTIKNNLTDKFPIENEVIINDFDEGINILLSLGCKKKYYYEKYREIWKLKNSEIIFDMNPGIPELMEVESLKKKELDILCKKLDLNINNYEGFGNNKLYMDLFGIVVPKTLDLTFKNAKKELKPRKNKDEFLKLVMMQVKEFKKIK
jgi:predicted adenylyl cyclase CyaB